MRFHPVGRKIDRMETPGCFHSAGGVSQKKGYSFKMTIIGTGEMEEQLHNMIRDKNLEDCVEMPGAMKASEVRSYMEKPIFTSSPVISTKAGERF